MAEKKYSITPCKNGFVVGFDHEDNSYHDENKRVAHSLEEVLEVIKEDLNSIESGEDSEENEEDT